MSKQIFTVVRTMQYENTYKTQVECSFSTLKKAQNFIRRFAADYWDGLNVLMGYWDAAAYTDEYHTELYEELLIQPNNVY